MINLNEQYPNKTAGVTPNYPFGQARNVTLPGDRTGTPWDQALVNDLIGFQQAAMKAANMVPSGVPDNANTSQVLDAILKIMQDMNNREYVDVKSQRADRGVYMNDTDYPMTVYFGFKDSSNAGFGFKVGDTVILNGLRDIPDNIYYNFHFEVPPRTSYSIWWGSLSSPGTALQVDYWFEYKKVN